MPQCQCPHADFLMGIPAPEPSEDAMVLIGLQNFENDAISACQMFSMFSEMLIYCKSFSAELLLICAENVAQICAKEALFSDL